MTFTTLIDHTELVAHAGDPDWRLFDCRFSLADTAAGRRAYESDHIPGAIYVDLDKDLSGATTGSNGRHPLPSAEAFAARLGEWGVSGTTQVVIYDAGRDAFAARMWWMLRWLGHEAVAVLDGGYEAWVAAGHPVTGEVPDVAPATFKPRVARMATVDAEAVAANLDTRAALVVDARGRERFTGATEPLDPVAGHVPGAVNLPYTGNLDTSGRFLPAGALRRRFAAVLAPGQGGAEVVHMCGSGVTACHNLLAMEIAGLHGSRLYPGSWSEWVADRKRPVAVGE